MTDARISRAVPLDQLRQPETDVRERRPDQAVKSLAASMGDPAVGQLQDILVHPVLDDLDEPPETEDDLHQLFQDGHPLRVVDGETRRLAAETLGWATINATIVPEPPEDQVIASLDANTERIEMDEAETVRALYQHYQETENTLADIGDKTGYSESYLSNVFGLFKAPDWLQEAWRHPEHPLETSHALAVQAMLSDNNIEAYQEAGDLDREAAWDQAVKDARLMTDVQLEHDLGVTDFRGRCKRCRQDTLDQLRDQRSLDEKRADGQTQRAEQAERAHTPAETPDRTCRVCGDEADRKIALDVCREDYGMLSEIQANDDVLMANADAPAEIPASPENGETGLSADPPAYLAEWLGLPDDQAEAVAAELADQAAETQPQTND